MQNITRIYALSKRNVILRYKNSLVGFFWGFFKPLLYLLILIVVFSQVSNIDNFVLYATSGLVFWFYFANVTNQSIASIISSAGIIKSLNIPVLFFPLSETLSELFNLMLTLVVFSIVMHWFGMVYSWKLLLVIPAAFLFSFFTLGITLILCSLNVFFRDIGILWTTMQPALFYLTPIAYPESIITNHYAFVVKFNPIYYFIKLARGLIYSPDLPSLALWMHCALIASVSFVFGYFIFNKLKNQFISAI